MANPQINVAVCGIGLDAYWPQFKGLRDRLEGYVEHVMRQIEGTGAVVSNLGLIDSSLKAREAARTCRRSDIDLLILYITTYALSGTVLPLVQRAGVPVLVLNLQPSQAIDYAAFNRLADRTEMTGEWLAYCSACTLPEIANVFLRAGIGFHQVTGILDDEITWKEIADWLAAARVKKVLSENRLGLLGHYYSGMYDISTDLTQLAITFGCDVEHIEMDELTAMREQVSDEAIAARTAEFFDHFDVQPDCSRDELANAARSSLALDRLVNEYNLQSLAYYYKGSGVVSNQDTISSMILGASLLTAQGVPVAGEYEVKNVIAMKIMDSFGAGGSFTEYYALDFNLDHVLMGHDGPGHIAIAEGKTRVRPLDVYHGKVGRGLSVEMSVRHGPVTLLSVVEDREHGFRLLAAEGESVPGEILRIGNTNSHYRFPIGARAFVETWSMNGPAHHCAVGVGHIATGIEKLAQLINIHFKKVC